MLSGIFDILKSIGEFFVLAFDFVITFFQDLVNFIVSLQATIYAVPSYLAWLPAPFLLLLGWILIVVVLLRVLGRD